ncbi:MAG: hypothetical protein J6R59_10730 [Paludibacteraceae bacterium]|nr:hypothetical protein [Paludibacteraceae bacterium]
MTTIKATTKRGQTMLNNASYNEGYSLRDVYGNFSYAKEKAYNYCLAQCAKENGYNFHICSHNTFNFSVAWETEEGTRIETANNSYLITNN